VTPLQAVVWAAFFNFRGGLRASAFRSPRRLWQGPLVEPAIVDQWVILAGLVGAIFWI